MFIALILGYIGGFLTTIPVAGPVSALMLTLTLKGNKQQARLMACGAALAETIYANLAFFGFNHFIKDAKYLERASSILGALILAGLGVYFYTSKNLRVAHLSDSKEEVRPFRSFMLGLTLGGSNVTLLATWTLALTIMNSYHLFEFTNLNFFLFSISFAAGIITWFFIFISLVSKYKSQFQHHILDKILKGVGVVLVVLSIWMLSQASK